jgi:hypothetical protein
MPLSPTDQAAAGHPVPLYRRVVLDSPLAGAARGLAYRRFTREQPRERGMHALAALGALLVHLVFLFGFILGPAFEETPAPASTEQFMQVRLIEAPEPPPPPPPPMRGTPPKELGPSHQGRVSQAAPTSQRSASTQATARAAVAAVQSVPATAPPVTAQAAKPSAPKPEPVATHAPPMSLPTPAPTPQLQAISFASEPPAVALPTPSLQPPVPPKFQPEPVRQAQLEGNRPLPPPASLALPELPAQVPPPVAVPTIALNTVVPKSSAPASVTPARAEIPTAPPVPEVQDIPLPAQPAPTVNLKSQVSAPAANVPNELPQVQAAASEVAEVQLEAIPLAPVAPPQVEPRAPSAKIAVADKAAMPAISPSVERPLLSAPPTVAAATAPVQQPSSANKAADSSAPAATEQAAATHSQSQASAEQSSPPRAHVGRDLSTAPNATPQGSDSATPGEPHGVDAAPESTGKNATGRQPKPGQGIGKSTAGTQRGAGQTGGNQAGATQGEKQGELGSYVQLKPHGDTDVMSHGARNIGYKPTRFEQDWTPEGESSIDTALRHAVEKTTVSHTFHLPRGVRVKCVAIPLLPMALFGCGNADPPPEPVAEDVYDRLHLAPANPLVSPASTTSNLAPAPMIKLDHSVECAEARVVGGPPPPGCAAIVLPVKPASSSSSWVPASDQFH